MVDNSEPATIEMINQFVSKEEPILFQSTVKKLTRWNIAQKRILIVTSERFYLFDDYANLIRRHEMTELEAIVKSSISSEIVFVFSMKDSKDLRIAGIADTQLL